LKQYNLTYKCQFLILTARLRDFWWNIHPTIKQTNKQVQKICFPSFFKPKFFRKAVLEQIGAFFEFLVSKITQPRGWKKFFLWFFLPLSYAFQHIQNLWLLYFFWGFFSFGRTVLEHRSGSLLIVKWENFYANGSGCMQTNESSM